MLCPVERINACALAPFGDPPKWFVTHEHLDDLWLAGGGQVGGRNTVLVDALTRRIPLVSDIPTIIFGADVTHPHPGEDSSPSIAAVSSLLTRFFLSDMVFSFLHCRTSQLHPRLGFSSSVA